MYYVDTSAFVKLVVLEEETSALRAWWPDGENPVATSALTRTELLRAVLKREPTRLDDARVVLDTGLEVVLDRTLLDQAATLPPVHLRSLDAIHLASALSLGSDCEGLVSYDQRLLDAATELGLAVLAPR